MQSGHDRRGLQRSFPPPRLRARLTTTTWEAGSTGARAVISDLCPPPPPLPTSSAGASAEAAAEEAPGRSASSSSSSFRLGSDDEDAMFSITRSARISFHPPPPSPLATPPSPSFTFCDMASKLFPSTAAETASAATSARPTVPTFFSGLDDDDDSSSSSASAAAAGAVNGRTPRTRGVRRAARRGEEADIGRSLRVARGAAERG